MCQAILVSLKERGFPNVPSNKCKWKAIAKEFENKYNFPHALGAIDGKHVACKHPLIQALNILIIKRHTALFC